MSVAERSLYQLVDGVLTHGILFIGSYLRNQIKRPVIITDYQGKIHFPDMSGQVDDLFIELPLPVYDSEYYYCEENDSLYYHIGCNGASAYVIIQNLTPNHVTSTVSLISDVKIAIKCYFVTINKDDKRFEREIIDYLIFKNNANLQDIIKLSDKHLDIKKPYFISILSSEGPDLDVDWKMIRSYACEYLKRDKIEAIPISFPDFLMFLIPAHSNNDPFESDPLAEKIADKRFKEAIEKRYEISLSQGISKSYPLADLHKSYYEAQVALTLPRLLGQKCFVQEFSDLGVFTHLFSHDPDLLSSYCHKILGNLVDDGELLQTLRVLLDNSYNWKTTADQLFIHVNTLHYRINKIEQMLSIDISQMAARANLFTAIKVWDALRTMNS